MENAIFAQVDVVADHGVGADANSSAEPGARRNYGAGIDLDRGCVARYRSAHS
jgi:hypothetical protein